jgi:REP element-mobilizing transposase RayT
MPPFLMFQISRTTPAYYLTSVCHDRLPIFRTPSIAQIACDALAEARRSAGFLLFAYVLMPDHIHIITDRSRTITDTLRFTNGIIARRVINYLKENDYIESLNKLRIQTRDRKHKYALFQHHPNAFEIYRDDTMMQKVNYVHMNPVRAEFVEHPNDYQFSSARQWNRKSLETEPLIVDHKLINWRAAA